MNNWSPQELAALQQLRDRAYTNKNLGAIGAYAYGEYASNPTELEDNIRQFSEFCECMDNSPSIAESALQRQQRRKLLAALLATRETSEDAALSAEIDRLIAEVMGDMDEDDGGGLEDFEESTTDFAQRCQRPDGTHYGTNGQCRKGKEVANLEKRIAQQERFLKTANPSNYSPKEIEIEKKELQRLKSQLAGLKSTTKKPKSVKEADAMVQSLLDETKDGAMWDEATDQLSEVASAMLKGDSTEGMLAEPYEFHIRNLMDDGMKDAGDIAQEIAAEVIASSDRGPYQAYYLGTGRHLEKDMEQVQSSYEKAGLSKEEAAKKADRFYDEFLKGSFYL